MFVGGQSTLLPTGGLATEKLVAAFEDSGATHALLVPTLLVLLLAGLTSTTFFSTSNALLQLQTADAMRGRVLAVYIMGFTAAYPEGSPWISFSMRTGSAMTPSAFFAFTRSFTRSIKA